MQINRPLLVRPLLAQIANVLAYFQSQPILQREFAECDTLFKVRRQVWYPCFTLLLPHHLRRLTLRPLVHMFSTEQNHFFISLHFRSQLTTYDGSSSAVSPNAALGSGSALVISGSPLLIRFPRCHLPTPSSYHTVQLILFPFQGVPHNAFGRKQWTAGCDSL